MSTPPSEYLDFEIRIWREAEHYFAQVTESEQGSSARTSLDELFESPREAEMLMLRLENALLREGSRASVEEKALRDFGEAVFDTIFLAEPISALYANSVEAADRRAGLAGIRVRLRIDAPDLAQFPWEYLYNRHRREWLGLFHRSPIIRRLDVLSPTAPLILTGPLNILGMIANPGTKKWKPIDAERERRRIDHAIEPHQRSGAVNFCWTPAGTSDALIRMMGQKDWHVFHFIGHGGMPSRTAEDDEGGIPAASDGDEAREGFIVFENGQGGHREVQANDLKPMLQQRGRGSLRLVFLNCCESGRGTAEDVFASPAAALVRAGVSHVIAMQFPIKEDAAIELSSVIYEKLAEGWAIEAALTAARVSMWDKSRIDWGIPVLYTRSQSGQLFATSGSSRQATAAPTAVVQPDHSRLDARARLRQLYGLP